MVATKARQQIAVDICGGTGKAYFLSTVLVKILFGGDIALAIATSVEPVIFLFHRTNRIHGILYLKWNSSLGKKEQLFI